ncbi:hypothetical protein [Cohnella sp. GCM10027633]|uniref:hypothetical protein n=1 Tax=unclassified Cohnella TaxID=2636738 RepID=UPI00363F4533
MRITHDMLTDFNETLERAGSAMRILADKSLDGTFNVRLNEEPYIDEDNRRAFPNDTFYAELEMFLKSHGIKKIHYNNTKLSFWQIGESDNA